MAAETGLIFHRCRTAEQRAIQGDTGSAVLRRTNIRWLIKGDGLLRGVAVVAIRARCVAILIQHHGFYRGMQVAAGRERVTLL